MALNINKTSTASLHPPEPYRYSRSLLKHEYPFLKRRSSSSSSSSPFIRLVVLGAQSEKTEGATGTEELSSARAQLDLLEQLTSSGSSTSDSEAGSGSDSGGKGGTIRDQLLRLVGDRDDDFSILLGKKNLKKVSAKFLTTSQKRNIKRQEYLNQVSKRNDSVFFATIGAFVLLPPLVILGLAVLTGYVQLFP